MTLIRLKVPKNKETKSTMIGRLVHRHPPYGEHKKTLKRNNLSTCDVVTSQFTERERIRSDQYLTLQSPLLISEPWFTCITEQ